MEVKNQLLMDAVAAINARFSSGNSVPVDRAWVTYAEWKNLQFALSLALTPPEGYVLVPVEPTEAMLNEGYGWVDGTGLELAYRSMLSVRPEVKS